MTLRKLDKAVTILGPCMIVISFLLSEALPKHPQFDYLIRMAS
jgi:hypothetical protein